MKLVIGALAACIAGTLGATAHAGVLVPFTEGFDNDNANWFDAGGAAPVDWVSGGGPAGDLDAYVSTQFAFANAGPFGATLFRGQDGFDSSGDAFVGDWIASGVDTFSFSFRHNAPVPVPVFVRFASPANAPAAVGIAFAPVMPNTWTDITIPIFDGSPNLVSFEGADFDTVFSNIGNLQIGVDVPDGFGEDMTPYTFDFDNAAITPAPGALALLGLAGLAGRRRR